MASGYATKDTAIFQWNMTNDAPRCLPHNPSKRHNTITTNSTQLLHAPHPITSLTSACAALNEHHWLFPDCSKELARGRLTDGTLTFCPQGLPVTGLPPTFRLVSADADLDNDADLADLDNETTLNRPTSVPTFLTDWNSLCESFTNATGTPLAFRGPHDPAFPTTSVWETEVPAAGSYAPGTLGLLKPFANRANSASDVEATTALAQHVGSLVEQLHESHRTLWQRNAELATAVPMIVDTNEESAKLAERFSSLLASAARAAGADTAAMFILDDATQLLQLRSHHGFDHSRFADAPRELRTSPADIEALAGNAIVLEDTADSLALLPGLVTEGGPSTSAPGAAICIPISSATVPLGTLWVFADEATDFSDIQVDMVEIIAGRLAAEMEREILLREQGALGNSAHVGDAIDWQRDQLPTSCTIDCGIERWQIAARSASQSRLHGDYYRWQASQGKRAKKADQLKLALATSHARGIRAALSTARIGGWMTGLLDNTNKRNSVQSVEHINKALWNGSAGDDQASLFFGQLNQSTGELRFCAAGLVDVYVIRPHGWEPIVQLNDLPVGSLEASDSLTEHRCVVERDDTLLVLSGRPRLRARNNVDGQVDGAHYAEAALHHNHLPADQLTLLLSGLWDHQTSPWAMPPAQLVLRRPIASSGCLL